MVAAYCFIAAYIDAGSGGILLQSLAAGLFALLLFGSRLRNWVVGRLHRSRGPVSGGGEDERP